MTKLRDCLEYEGKYGYEMEYFWVSGVFLVMLGFLGLIGNILNLTILFRSTFRKDVIYQLLIVLSLFDTIYIFSYALDMGYYSMACRDSYKDPIELVALRFQYIGLIGSIYTTVMISLERCLVMSECLIWYSRKFWIYIIPIITITFGYNIPFLFDHEFYRDSNGNLHFIAKDWNNEIYKYRYYGWSAIFVDDFIPLPIIIILNFFIIKKVRRRPKNLIKVSEEKKLHRQEVTKMLLIVTFAFVMIRSLDLIFQILWFFGVNDESFRKKWMFLEPINDLMLMVNSSINFVIYCMVGTKFRVEFKQTYGCKFRNGIVGNTQKKRFHITMRCL